jgi:hypothetical protein
MKMYKLYDSSGYTYDLGVYLDKDRQKAAQHLPATHATKMYKLCDSSGYTYDMDVYLGKDRQRAVQHLPATHASDKSDKKNRRSWS